MSKDQKKPEAAAPKPEGKPQGAPQSAPSGGGGSSKGAVGQKVGCQAWTCKSKDTRAGFCDEHFKQFKFGLIKKTGEPVSDFEKKFEHYQHWLKSQKVA